MAKKPSYEDAVAQREAATKKRQEATAAKEKYAKDNGLKPKQNHSEDAKHGKAWKKLHKTYLDAKEEETAAKEIEKELKPKTERATKYEYPADVVTVDDKKKFRAKMRAEAKRAANPKKEKEPKAEKPAKASKKEEAPAAAEKSDKKKKKKAKVAETED